MKQKIILLAITLLMATAITAQNNKFGKPSQEEWQLDNVPFAPEAEAVVLYKSVNLTYTVSGAFTAYGSGGEGSLDDNPFANAGKNKYINPEATTMLYDVKLRTKILKDSGAKYATIDIITFNEKDNLNQQEEFYDMKVQVFSMVNGKLKKRKLTTEDFTDERLNTYYSIRHIRIPDAKAGDIIEYQYQLFSNRITYIYNTQLQENIPVLYARCTLDIPYFLQFNVNKPELPNVKASVKLGQTLIKSPNNDGSMPRKCVTNLYDIEARNLQPYNGTIDLQAITSGNVYTVRTSLKEKRYDVTTDTAGPVRHMIISK